MGDGVGWDGVGVGWSKSGMEWEWEHDVQVENP